MTIKVKIEHTGTHGAILVDRGDVVHVALRPGESTEAHVWEGSTLRILELTDVKQKDIVWLTERATDGPSSVG